MNFSRLVLYFQELLLADVMQLRSLTGVSLLDTALQQRFFRISQFPFRPTSMTIILNLMDVRVVEVGCV